MEALERLSPDEALQSERARICVLLDDVRSLMNVGSVFRSCDAFRVHTLYLAGYTPKPPHRDIQRTALGASRSVNWEAVDSAADLIDRLKEQAWRIVAVEQVEGSIMLQDFRPDPQDSVLLIFGNEVEGVSDELLARCDDCIEIPQFGHKHSINVSVSTGVVLWDLYSKMYLQ